MTSVVVVLREARENFDQAVEAAARSVEIAAVTAPTVEAGLAALSGYAILLGERRFEWLRHKIIETGPETLAYRDTVKKLAAEAAEQPNLDAALDVFEKPGVLSNADLRRLVRKQAQLWLARQRASQASTPTIASTASVPSMPSSPRIEAVVPKPAAPSAARVIPSSGAPAAVAVSSVQPSRSRRTWAWFRGCSLKLKIALVASAAIGVCISTAVTLDVAKKSWLARQTFGYAPGDLVMSNRSVWGPGSIFAEVGRVREVVGVIGYGPCTAAGGDADDPVGAPAGRIGSWVITIANGNPAICQRVGDVQPIKRTVHSVAVTARDVVYQGGTLSRGRAYYVADIACPPSRVYPSIALEAAEVDVCVQLRDLVPTPWVDSWTPWVSIKDWWRSLFPPAVVDLD
jgi:hypothetical protein